MNIIRVEVRSKNTDRAREYKGKTYAEQQAAIYTGGDYPMPFKVNVEVGHEYEPGEYTIDPRCFTTDQYGNLVVKAVRLLPIGGASVGKAK